jgi:hypothetical protein
VHEVADVPLHHAAVAQDLVGAAVVGDDLVEGTRVARGVEL